jgi:AsmA protein
MKGEVVLKEAALTLDEVKASGDVGFEFAGAKPSLLARLSMNKLDLDRFTGGKEASSSSKGGAQRASSGGGEGWDATPLDFSGLRKLNADLKLKTEGFSLRGTDVGPSTLEVKLLNGSLHFTSSEAALSDGKFSSDLRLNAVAATPSMSFVFDMTDVQAQPILATFAGFKKLSGAANAHVSLTGSGNSQKDIISTLGGSGKVEFRDGELQGIDLVKIAKLVQKRSTDVGVDDGSTKFVTLAGTFTITNGIVSNTDMKMKGNVVQATGQGTVDLPRKYIQYKATPVLLVSGDAPPALSVPVKIVGPFDRIKVIPDFASAVRDIVNDPSSAKKAFKNIKENLKQNDFVQGILNLKKRKQAPMPQETPQEVPQEAPQESPPSAPVVPAEQKPVLIPSP